MFPPVVRRARKGTCVGSKPEARKREQQVKRGPVLIIISAFQFMLFVPLTWWAHKHPHPLVEVSLTHVLQQKRGAGWRKAITVLSTIAGSAVLLNLVGAPLAAVLLWKRQLRLEAIMTVGISWTSALFRTAIKRVVDRPRPNPLLVPISHHKQTKSFPSGHVTSTVDFWGWLIALGMMLMKGKFSWQKAVLGLPALCIAVTGPSRVYLGDHWATDVLGGYLFGGGWLCLALDVYLNLRDKKVLTK